MIGAVSNSESGLFFIKNSTVLRRKVENSALRPEHDLDPLCAATPTMSKTQCELVIDGGKLSVMDVGSRNGTYIVGPDEPKAEHAPGVKLKVNEPMEVQEGSILRIGPPKRKLYVYDWTKSRTIFALHA